MARGLRPTEEGVASGIRTALMPCTHRNLRYASISSAPRETFRILTKIRVPEYLFARLNANLTLACIVQIASTASGQHSPKRPKNPAGPCRPRFRGRANQGGNYGV